MFGIEKQLDRIVETLALSALMANNPNKKVEKRLNEIAFPLEIELEKEADLSISGFYKRAGKEMGKHLWFVNMMVLGIVTWLIVIKTQLGCGMDYVRIANDL